MFVGAEWRAEPPVGVQRRLLGRDGLLPIHLGRCAVYFGRFEGFVQKQG